MSIGKLILEEGIRQLKRSGGKAARHAATSARQVATSPQGRQALKVAKVAVQSGPARELATICGRAGVAGAVVDGAMGGMQAAKAMRDGTIDAAGAAKHVGAEAGCGFVTSSAGTAGTIAVYMVTGAMGPMALVAGMGASMGSRWAYRKVVGETLPAQVKGAAVDTASQSDKPADVEDIGPATSSRSSFEDIGPRGDGDDEA